MARRENHGSWKTIFICLCAALLIQAGPGNGSVNAQTEPKREVVWPGITSAGTVLLPNGWSLKPAGRQMPLGDLPVQIALHPTEPILAIAHAGYGEHEVVTVLAESWQDHRPGCLAGDVRRPGLVEGWEAALRRGRI